MREIIDYAVVRDSSQLEFGNCVRRLLAEGWQPYGEVVVLNLATMVQIMVKYKPEPKEKLEWAGYA